MKWTWESFGYYIEPDRPEPEKFEPAPEQIAQFEPAKIEPAKIDPTLNETGALESGVLGSESPEVITLDTEASELKTIPSRSHVPAGTQRIRRIIRESLHLRDGTPIEMQFYEATGKCAVIVQAKEVNPTWQEVLEASRRSGWEIEVFAAKKFERLKQSALQDFEQLQAITPGLAQSLIDHGFFTLRDLAATNVKVLMGLCGLDRMQAKQILQQAEFHAEQMEY